MQGLIVDHRSVRQLHHLAQIHDGDAVADVANHQDVVGDEEIGQAHLLLELHEHIDHLGLDGHVQGGDRLVADDELGLQCQTDRDAEAEKSIAKARKCAVTDDDPEMLNWMYYTQSTIYLHQQDTVRAIEALNNAVKYDPTDVECYMRLGNIYKRQREYDLAMVNYGLAVQYDRNNVEGYLGLGTVAGSLKKREDAIKAYTMAIKLRPEFAECYALRAVEYYNDWEYGKAMDDIISALELEQDNARALWVLEYIKETAPEEATKALQKKAKKSKDNSWLKLLD